MCRFRTLFYFASVGQGWGKGKAIVGQWLRLSFRQGVGKELARSWQGVGKELARSWQGVERELKGSSHTVAIQ